MDDDSIHYMSWFLIFLSFFLLIFVCGEAGEPSYPQIRNSVTCGYQGWFSASRDVDIKNWRHYSANHRAFEEGSLGIELWPDMTEMDADEKFVTNFKNSKGEPQFVYSSENKKTINRHFKWMKQYNIDGVYLQRFGTEIKNSNSANAQFVDSVLRSSLEAAIEHKRGISITYDLSGLESGELMSVIAQDWKRLCDQYRIREQSCFFHDAKKPVVMIWGVGFNDGRKYTLKETSELLEFFQNDPLYGGNRVIFGVPTFWREMKADAISDPLLHDMIRRSGMVSPWFVGRYKTILEVTKHTERNVKADIEWCQRNGVEYLPVCFPGFSWRNLMESRGKVESWNYIPRLQGSFFWSQASQYYKAGAKMLYIAMFDEMDEGTAIFKCTNDVPVGKAGRELFLTYEGLPSDHYLWLSGKINEMFKGKLPISENQPERKSDDRRLFDKLAPSK